MLTEVTRGATTSASAASSAACLGRVAAAKEVAQLALFLASDDSSYCTATEFVVDGGMPAV